MRNFVLYIYFIILNNTNNEYLKHKNNLYKVIR